MTISIIDIIDKKNNTVANSRHTLQWRFIKSALDSVAKPATLFHELVSVLYKIHCKNREKVRYHVGCCGKSNTEKDLQQSLYPRTNKPITTLNHYRIWANFYECKSTSKSISYNYLQLSINNTNATVNVQTHGRRNSTLTASTGPPYSLPLYISHASLGRPSLPQNGSPWRWKVCQPGGGQ